MEKEKKVVLIIPALDPPDSFPGYVKELLAAGFEHILIIDDGSKSTAVFDRIERAIILRHDTNKGKGRALKTGFSYYNDHFDSNAFVGVITLDCDGQHLVKDVQRVYEQMLKEPEHIILGSRDFSAPDIPPKSKFGNRTTSNVFRLFFGLKLSDTQTGLRGLSNDIINACLAVPGERFEYETSMLLRVGKKTGITEVPITTVYLEENQGTHFNPVKDSFRIYYAIFGTFFRYLLASLSSFVLDIVLFSLFDKLIFFGLPQQVVAATVCARVISAVFNFLVNRNVVFKSSDGYLSTALMYGLLCIAQMMASAGLVFAIYSLSGFEEVVIKIIVDVCLFFISFSVQRKLIFKRSRT